MPNFKYTLVDIYQLILPMLKVVPHHHYVKVERWDGAVGGCLSEAAALL